MFNFNPENREEGFTLIEMLVVILIIGVLAGVAIPMFLNQRKAANDAVVASDVKNISIAVETYFSKNRNADRVDPNWLKANAVKSDGVEIIIRGTHADYCIEGRHVNGDKWQSGVNWEENGNKRPYYLYHSIGGGEVQSMSKGVSILSCMKTESGANSPSMTWAA